MLNELYGLYHHETQLKLETSPVKTNSVIHIFLFSGQLTKGADLGGVGRARAELDICEEVCRLVIVRSVSVITVTNGQPLKIGHPGVSRLGKCGLVLY